MSQTLEGKILSRDLTKKAETYYDRVWIKHLIKEIQKLDSSVWAVIYKELKMIIFMTGKIMFYKVMMTENNMEKIKIQQHKERASQILRLLKLNLVPIKELSIAQRGSAKLNFDSGKIIK